MNLADRGPGWKIPLDPLSDEPFEWKINGDTAALKAPPLPEEVTQLGFRASAVEYRLRVKR